MRLYVEHRVEYASGPKKDFWHLVHDRFQAITGRDFKNVGERVGLLVRQRLSQLSRETSGTEQTCSELTIALDCWIEVIRDEQSRLMAARHKEQRREEAAEAQRTRDSLLQSRSVRERETEREDSDGGEGVSGAETPSTASRASRTSRKLPRKGDGPLESMATAIQGLASSWVASDELRSSDIVAVEIL